MHKIFNKKTNIHFINNVLTKKDKNKDDGLKNI